MTSLKGSEVLTGEPEEKKHQYQLQSALVLRLIFLLGGFRVEMQDRLKRGNLCLKVEKINVQRRENNLWFPISWTDE